jgi:hypothetical protein
MEADMREERGAMEVTLKNMFNKDQLILYKSRTEINNKATDKEKQKEIGTQTAHWEVEIEQRVLEIEKDQSAHIIYRSTPLSIPTEAQMMGVINKKQVIYILMNPQGKILDASGIGFQGIVNFPEKALKEGDKWQDTSTVDFPGLPQPIQHTRTFILKDFQAVGTHQCAHIIATSEETNLQVQSPDKSGTVNYSIKTTGEIFFAYKEGFLVKSTIDTSFSSTFGTTIMEGNNKFSQELLEVRTKVKA